MGKPSGVAITLVTSLSIDAIMTVTLPLNLDKILNVDVSPNTPICLKTEELVGRSCRHCCSYHCYCYYHSYCYCYCHHEQW